MYHGRWVSEGRILYAAQCRESSRMAKYRSQISRIFSTTDSTILIPPSQLGLDIAASLSRMHTSLQAGSCNGDA